MEDLWRFRAGLARALAACAGCLVISLAPPALGAPSVLILQRETLWAVRVHSAQLLADRGYAIEYTFEFLDEEELRVRSLGGAEISAGRVRTILDGEPSEIEIRRPRTAATAEERLATEAEGRRWEITWHGGELRIRLAPALATRETVVVYRDGRATGAVGGRSRLDPAEAMRITTLGRAYLAGARRRFGTEALTAPLPVITR